MKARAQFGDELTPREKEILQLLWEGLTTRAAAEGLGISMITVKSHLRAVRLKLGAETHAGVYRRALETGLLTFEREGES